MSNAVQTSFPFDMTPCGPVADAMARAADLAGLIEKLDCEDYRDAWDLYTPDFPEDA